MMEKIDAAAKQIKLNYMFIEKSTAKFGFKFDYKKVRYIKGDEEVIITCPEHGDFTIKPRNHLNSKIGGCPGCIAEASKNSNPNGDRRKTTEEFIEELKAIHPEVDYDYSKTVYKNRRTKVTVTCPEHGDFEAWPKDLLRGDNCPKCKIRKSANIDLRKKMHLDILASHPDSGLTYPNLEERVYGEDEEIDIVCPVHGAFKRKVKHHLSGYHCPACAAEKYSGWSRTDFVNKCDDELACLYIIHCFNDNEDFYKIGITSKTHKERFKKNDHMPYTYEVIKEYFGPAENIYDLENILLRDTKEHIYVPEIFFGGHTECRTKEILSIPSIFQILAP